jgi:hypothetical protein
MISSAVTVATEAMRLTDLDVLEWTRVAHAAVSGRRLSMVTPTTARTVSLLVGHLHRLERSRSVSSGTAGLENLPREVSVSLGRTGFSQRQESMPGDPALAARSRCPPRSAS